MKRKKAHRFPTRNEKIIEIFQCFEKSKAMYMKTVCKLLSLDQKGTRHINTLSESRIVELSYRPIVRYPALAVITEFLWL